MGPIRIGSFVAAAALLFLAPTARADENQKILVFATMAGVDVPFTGPTNAIRGVGGGGVPWTIERGEGVLRADGELDLEVRGLVIVSTGVNPAATFRAIVSCLTAGPVDPATNLPTADIVNVPTGEFPATTTGDARIRAQLPLPTPCFAPIVFVTNAAGRWFAVTGN